MVRTLISSTNLDNGVLVDGPSFSNLFDTTKPVENVKGQFTVMNYFEKKEFGRMRAL